MSGGMEIVEKIIVCVLFFLLAQSVAFFVLYFLN